MLSAGYKPSIPAVQRLHDYAGKLKVLHISVFTLLDRRLWTEWQLTLPECSAHLVRIVLIHHDVSKIFNFVTFS